MELHALSVKLLLNDEATAAHFLDRFLNPPCWTFAQHGSEGTKELDCLVLSHARDGSISGRVSVDDQDW